MQIADVYELMDRFEESSMSDFQLEFDGLRLSCKRDSESSYKSQSAAVDSKIEGKFVASDVKKASIVKVKENKTENREETVLEKLDEGMVDVCAQIAGTFYREPSPDSEPFVQVGQIVKKGDTLGLLEAMKMFSNVTSPVDGEVVEIQKESGTLAGYQEVLVRLKEQSNV